MIDAIEFNQIQCGLKRMLLRAVRRAAKLISTWASCVSHRTTALSAGAPLMLLQLSILDFTEDFHGTDTARDFSTLNGIDCGRTSEANSTLDFGFH